MADQNEEDDVLSESGAPPEADTVALRALSVASLLRRLALETRGAPPAEHTALSKWVETNGLFASFGEGGIALFDAEPNSWDLDAKESVAWAAEELQLLAWALGQAEAPALFARAPVEALLASLPSSGDVGPISLAASLRPTRDLETLSALYETLGNAGRLEAWARGVAEDATLAADDEELEELLSAMASTGFERERLVREKGAQATAALALRTMSRQLVTDLFEAKSPHAAYAFDAKRLEALENEALAVFIATAQLRGEALVWLLEGDAWDEGED